MIHPGATGQLIGHRLRTGVARCALAFARGAGIAALLTVYADAPAKESFGRLFFDTEERRVLDDRRRDGTPPPPSLPSSAAKKAAAPVVDVLSFDGKVERSGGGGTTIWINGRPVLTGSRTVEGIRVQSNRGTDGETTFTLPPSDVGKTDFSLKVGQKIAVQSGKVLDSYEASAGEDAENVFATDPDAKPPAPGPDPEESDGSEKTAPTPGS